jgi:hypothetical protein
LPSDEVTARLESDTSASQASRRKLVEVRCGFAEMAGKEAEAAEERAARARRTYNIQLAALKSVQAANPGAVRKLKEEAHRAFRRRVFAAKTHDEVEAAAAAWLRDINRINGAARATLIKIQRERDEVEALGAELDRLASTAEASRAMADSAAAACRAAQQALAGEGRDDEIEALLRAAAAPPPLPPEAGPAGAGTAEKQPGPEADAAGQVLRPFSVSRHVPGLGVVSGGPSQPVPVPEAETPAPAVQAPTPAPQAPVAKAVAPAAEAPTAAPVAQAPAPVARAAAPGPARGAQPAAQPQVPPGPAAAPGPAEAARPVNYRAQDPPRLVRLLQGDPAAMASLLDELAGKDPTERQRWRSCLESLIDAVVAAAVEHGYFVFPRDHPFWGQFTREQARELALGLAALGFRYDGRGGFADERVPGPRDMTMAAGNAGLPTVRIRYWPPVEDAAYLFAEAGIDVTAVLLAQAPAATMGELVKLVGRNASVLTDLWNDWARVRPLLLAPSRG